MKQITLLFMLIFLGFQGSAQIITEWNGNVNDRWDNPGNWSNGVPDATKTAKIVYFDPAKPNPVIYNSTSFKGLEMTNFGRAYTIIVKNGAQLTMDNLSTPGGTSPSDYLFDIGDGDVTVNNIVTNNGEIRIKDGSFIAAGGLTSNGIFAVETGSVIVGTPSIPANFSTTGNSDIILNEGSLTVYGATTLADSSTLVVGEATIVYHGNVTFMGSNVYQPGENSLTILDGDFNLTAGNAGLKMVFNSLTITAGSQITSKTELIVNTDLTCLGTLDVKSYSGDNTGQHGPIDIIGNISGAENITSLYPYAIKAEVTGSNTIAVLFDQALYKPNAETHSYYKIYKTVAGNTEGNTVTGASLSGDLKTVTLTTANVIDPNDDFVLFVKGGNQYSSGTWIEGVIDNDDYHSVSAPFHKKRIVSSSNGGGRVNYVYYNGAWTPQDPSGISTLSDFITVVNGSTTLTADTDTGNLTVDVAGTLNIEHVLNLAEDLNVKGSLVFKSNATGNGELGPVSSSATIRGNKVTVERYMSANRSYRMVSPAVTTTTSIHDNWQEGATSNTHNPHSGFGTHITGTGTHGDQYNGFDKTETGNPSLYYVNNGAQVFTAIENTDSKTLTAGSPYLMMVRGDRSINLESNTSFGATTLRATGTLAVGAQTQTFATVNAGDYVMFGNPYQSAVDINKVFANSTNLNTNFYYVYDPTLGTAGKEGAYVTVTLPGGTSTSSSTIYQFLQPGQAAQVATAAAGPSSVVFAETDKAPGKHTSTNRPMVVNNMLTVQLYTTENFSNGGSVHDSFGMLFAEGYDNGLTLEDAVKPFNFYENLGIDHNGTYLSLERREIPQPEEVYQLYSTGYSHTDYTLKLSVDGLEEVSLYLLDNFTGTSTLLEAGDNIYAFSVDANNPNSIATDRFTIRTEQRLGVDDNDSLKGIVIYPNPLNADTFFINVPRLNGEQLMVNINDLTGRIIFEQNLECNANTVTVPLGSDIASGVYLVTLKHGGEAHTYRLIKE